MMERFDTCTPCFVRGGIDFGDVARDRIHLSVSLLQGHAGFKASHNQQPVAVVSELLGFEGEGNHQLGFEAIRHAGSQHANDCVRFAV